LAFFAICKALIPLYLARMKRGCISMPFLFVNIPLIGLGRTVLDELLS
jgi:hypothetical protein